MLLSSVSAGCDHSWAFADNGTGSATKYTYDGKVAVAYEATSDSNAYRNIVTYWYGIYGLGVDGGYRYYVNSGYKLIYIGGNFYSNTSNNWSEKTNISAYLYPSYINYFRPGV